jgi:hypothetical protein
MFGLKKHSLRIKTDRGRVFYNPDLASNLSVVQAFLPLIFTDASRVDFLNPIRENQ